MRHRNRASAWFALVALAAGGAALAAGPDLLWPVALEPGVASNFCDYRDGRFHAGIDVRTFGREGVPCRAVGDGWVSRVRASSRGYGKALHVTLDSGVQVLYAHLAEFAPELEETLWAEQQRAGRYGVDFTVPAHRFRFRRGEIVAYSGSTGATAPHLHFEVRSLEDVPLNPLTHGLSLPDHDRPTVPRVAFVPLSASAQVEGRCYPLEIEPRRVGSGRYQIDDTLRFGGDVGLAATVVDKLNRRSGNLAPHEMQVWSDGSQLTRVTFDGFGFDDVKDVDHALDMGALRARGTDVYTLYQRDGDARERAEFLRGGRIAPAPSTRRVHEGRLVALDAAGNRTQVAFHYMDSLTVETPAREGSIAGARWSESHLAVDLGGSYFHDGFAVVLVYDTRHRLVERRHVDQHEEHVDTVMVRAAELIERTRPLARALADDSATVWLSAIPAARAGKNSIRGRGLRSPVPGRCGVRGRGRVRGRRGCCARGTTALAQAAHAGRVAGARWTRVRAQRVGATARRTAESARRRLSRGSERWAVGVSSHDDGFGGPFGLDRSARRVRRVPRRHRTVARGGASRRRNVVRHRR